MVQGDNPLEVNSESELDEDVDMSYYELALFCQQLLKKYDLLKKDNKKLKNKYDSILKEKDSFQNKFEIISEENESLKKNYFGWKKETTLNENDSLKKKNILKEKANISLS